MLLRSIFPALGLAGDLVDLLVDRGIVHLDVQALKLDPVDVRCRHIRQSFDADGDLGVLTRLILLVELDLWLKRRADVLLGEKLLDAVLHRAVERVSLKRVPMSGDVSRPSPSS